MPMPRKEIAQLKTKSLEELKSMLNTYTDNFHKYRAMGFIEGVSLMMSYMNHVEKQIKKISE